jgi:hypothetical protein
MIDDLMEFPSLPIHPPRVVEARRGWLWLKDSFAYFMQAPLPWLGILLALLLIGIGVALIPLLGPLINAVLPPVWGAGVMVGCHAQYCGQPLRVQHVFAGFGPTLKTLVLSGVILILLELLVVLVTLGPSFLSLLAAGDDPAALEAAVREKPLLVMLQLLIMAALMVPIAAAAWYSPALIVLSGQDVKNALLLSLKACFINIWPLLIWGIASVVLALIGSIPFGLGLLVVLPMMIASVYLSYRDIFVD